MTRVSVIIPCYNYASFVGEAIQSASAQRWSSTEIVVVDDGSTDESYDVARRFERIHLIRQPNQGLSSARNTGLRSSSGDVIIFLDADDVLLPDAAEAAVQALNRHPEAMMVFGRLEMMDVSGRPTGETAPRVTGDFYQALLRRNYVGTPAMAAFRRNIFELIGGFDPTCSPSADYDLYLRIARRFPIATHDTLVARYRQHAGSMSRNARLMLPATLRVLKRHRKAALGHAEAYRCGLQHAHEFYGEQLVEQFRAALRRKNGGAEAIACAADLLRLYPQGVAKHLAKKMSMTLGYAGRAMPDSDTARPSSRASTLPGSR